VLKRPTLFEAFHQNRTPLPTDPKTIGEHLHKKRHDLGLTHRQLADPRGVCLPTLNRWEANLHQPTGKVGARVVAWLGFDPRLAE
jgi:predicted transcriptional regulator